jgi:signal transduction histidine kinase
MALFLGLFLLSQGVLVYFNLTLAAQDNQLRTEIAGHRLAEQVTGQIAPLLQSPNQPLTPETLMGTKRGSALSVEQLRKFKELRQIDLYLANGQRVFSLGTVSNHPVTQDASIQRVMRTKSEDSSTWIYHDAQGDQGEKIANAGFWVQGWIAQEHYWCICDSTGKVIGVGHLCLEIPRAALRMNLALIGNLLLSAIFSVTCGLAIYLWGEFALNRPLQALMASEQRLTELDPSKALSEDRLVSSNQLSNLARSFDRLSMQLVKYQRELEQKTQRLESTNQDYRSLNEQLELKVEEKTKEMKEFFSLVTHDLRIPLAAVAGYSDLLSKGKHSELTEKQKKYVAQISQANRHAQDMVINLLEAMRYEFSPSMMVPETFDLIEVANEVTHQLSVHGKHIELHLPGHALTRGERTKIGRVLGNLLGNALRYAHNVQLTISEVSAGEEACPAWSISIQDDGPGIPAEQLPHLFERFKHIQAQEGASGLGLGLYIVKRILNEHGSDICVESKQQVLDQPEPASHGTKFSFSLPKQEKEES